VGSQFLYLDSIQQKETIIFMSSNQRIKTLLIALSAVLLFHGAMAQNAGNVFPIQQLSNNVNAQFPIGQFKIGLGIPLMNDTATSLNNIPDSLGWLIQIRTTGALYRRDTVVGGGHYWNNIGSGATGAYLPLTFSSSQLINGNGNPLVIKNGALYIQIPATASTGIAADDIYLTDTTLGRRTDIAENSGGLAIEPADAVGGNGFFQHGLGLFPDTLELFPADSEFLFLGITGNAIFKGNLSLKAPANSDSTNTAVSSAWVKHLLAGYTPGGALQNLTFGLGFKTGTYNGSAAVTLLPDTSYLVTHAVLGDSTASLRNADTVIKPGWGTWSPTPIGLAKIIQTDTNALDQRYVKLTDTSHHLIIAKSSSRGINTLWGHDSTLVGKGVVGSGASWAQLDADSTLDIVTPVAPSLPIRNELQVAITNNHVCEGNSITYGYTLGSPSTQNYCALLADTLALTSMTNRAVPGSAVDDILSRQFNGDPAGDVGYSYSVMMGENNYGEDTSILKYTAIREGVRTSVANHFLDSAWAISNSAITKTGTWTNLSGPISKSSLKSLGNPMYSSVAGNTLSFTVYDNNLVIGTYGYRSTSYGSVSVSIDGVLQVNPITGTTVFSGSNMCDNFASEINTYDPRQPIVWVFNSLGMGPHAVVITLLQSLETDFDYIGKLVTPDKATGMIVFHMTKFTKAVTGGWGQGSGPAGADSANRNIDSVTNYFRRMGLPVTVAQDNEWLNNSYYYTDGIHFTSAGQVQLARSGLSRIVRATSGGGGGVPISDTATATSNGFMTAHDKIMLLHPITIRKAYCTTCDSLAYSIADTMFLRGLSIAFGLKHFIGSPDSISLGVDTSLITSIKRFYSYVDSTTIPVTAFTGIPNGVNDNSTGLQAAWNYAAANGKNIYVPAGSYVDSVQLNAPTSGYLGVSWIFGDNAVINYPPATGTLFAFSGAPFAHMRFMNAHLTSTHVITATGNNGIFFQGIGAYKIKDVKIIGGYFSGFSTDILGKGLGDAEIAGIHFYNPLGHDNATNTTAPAVNIRAIDDSVGDGNFKWDIHDNWGQGYTGMGAIATTTTTGAPMDGWFYGHVSGAAIHDNILDYYGIEDILYQPGVTYLDSNVTSIYHNHINARIPAGSAWSGVKMRGNYGIRAEGQRLNIDDNDINNATTGILFYATSAWNFAFTRTNITNNHIWFTMDSTMRPTVGIQYQGYGGSLHSKYADISFNQVYADSAFFSNTVRAISVVFTDSAHVTGNRIFESRVTKMGGGMHGIDLNQCVGLVLGVNPMMGVDTSVFAQSTTYDYELADSMATTRGLLALKAPLVSPAFTGTPTVPTQSTSDSSTEAVNSAWVKQQHFGSGGGGGGITTPVSVPNGGTGVATLTGIVKGNGTSNMSAATSGTDYAPGTSGLSTGIVKSTTSTGALSIAVASDFPTLNQNTTGTAANVTGTVAVGNGGTGATTLTGMVKGNGTSAMTAATSGTDFTPGMAGLGTGIVKNTTGSGAVSIAVASDFPTLNQNTTGTAANVTGTVAVGNGGTGATTLTGIVKGNGTSAMTAATSGSDYAPGTASLSTGIVKSTTSTGALSIAVASDFPTLNQNTTGTAANLSGTPALPNGTTATTQTAGDNSTKVSTTAYANAAATAAVAALPNAFTSWQNVGAGGTYTITKSYVACAPSSSATISLGLPSSPTDGQTEEIYVGNGVGTATVTLTITAASGQTITYQGSNLLSSIGGSSYNRGSHFALIWNSNNSAWYCTSQTY
jgi:hypothetical protein